MQLLSSVEMILFCVFLFASMLSVGMQTGAADIRSLLASRGLLARSLAANFVLAPLAGVLLVRLLPLASPVAGALLLLACSPGGLSSAQFTTKVKGGSAYVGAMVFLLSLLSLFISPLLMKMGLPGGVHLVIPYGRVLAYVATLLFLPLAVGMAVLHRSPGAASKLSKLLALVGLVAFVAFMVTTKDFRKEALKSIGAPAVGAMLLFIVASMAIGWLLGGPARDTRQMLATATSMRNAGLCLAIVEASAPGSAVVTPLVAFSLLMVPPNVLLTLYGAIKARKARSHGRP